MTKKTKILFLTDDPRFSSGIATVSRELILNTCHEFDYVIVGGSAKHPEEGRIVDLSESVSKESGVDNVNIKLYPVSGYGTPDLIRMILMVDQPDVLLHFTDPRYWVWLYNIEHEIRQQIPITYLNIWDAPPTPMFNKSYYKSCDLLMCISKQTYGLVNKVLAGENFKPWQITYVPHGLNENIFRPIKESDPEYSDVRKKRFELMNRELDYVVLLNSRNIRRKQIPDVIVAFNKFVETLPKNKADKCVLLLHTTPIDENGTNLIEVIKSVAPDANIAFSPGHLSPTDMNMLYNISDVVINVSSNEGWGLSITEARLAGKPIIVNMTGGLQDQIGLQKLTSNGIRKYITEQDYLDESFDSNSQLKYILWDEYAYAIKPQQSIQGSVPTPYIYDERASIEDITKAINHFYVMSDSKRRELGDMAREQAIKFNHTSKQMSEKLLSDIKTCLENWTPKERFSIHKI